MSWKALWDLVVDFPGDVLRAKWTVRVVEIDPTTEIMTRVVAERTIDISRDCLLIGELPIIGNRMQFNGKGYVQCAIPSYRDELATLMPELSRLPPRCACIDPYVTVDGRWEVRASTSTYPLFFHPDFSFTTPLIGGQAQSVLWLNEQPYPSPTWSINAAGNQVWSGVSPFLFSHVTGLFREGAPVGGSYTRWATFLNNVSFIQTTLLRPGLLHWRDAGTLYQDRAKPSYTLDTGPAYVYIGYNPITGDYFHGEVTLLATDPCGGPKFKG
jgi:hypothetical protein